jgi:hypothetical protein
MDDAADWIKYFHSHSSKEYASPKTCVAFKCGHGGYLSVDKAVIARCYGADERILVITTNHVERQVVGDLISSLYRLMDDDNTISVMTFDVSVNMSPDNDLFEDSLVSKICKDITQLKYRLDMMCDHGVTTLEVDTFEDARVLVDFAEAQRKLRG